jgi:hypothetical protein
MEAVFSKFKTYFATQSTYCLEASVKIISIPAGTGKNCFQILKC